MTQKIFDGLVRNSGDVQNRRRRMPEIEPVDRFVWEHRGSVMAVVTWVLTKFGELIFAWFKAKMDSKVGGMRESLYIELGKNIGGQRAAEFVGCHPDIL